MVGSYNTIKMNVSEKVKKNYSLYIILVLIMVLGNFTVFLPKETFLALTVEDGPFENVAAMMLGLTAVLFFVLFFNKNKFYKAEDSAYFSTKFRRIFFLLLGLLFIVLLGEEISWGQRILGFETPENIEKRNIQNEFNFHNLDVFHLRTEETGRKTGLAYWLTAKKLFIYLFVTYLFLIPFAVRVSETFRTLTRRFYLPVPMMELGVLFILDVILFKAFKPFTDGTTAMMRGLAEVEEFNFALILFMLPFIWIGMPLKKLPLSKII